MRESLIRQMGELLLAEPGQSARELTAAIDQPGVTKTQVNSLLHGRPDVFEKTDDTPPLWSVREDALTKSMPSTASRATAPAGNATFGSQGAGPALRAWQQRALTAWCDNDHRGIVEAVDGAGKTVLGAAAAAEAVAAGRQVIVVVPGPDQQQQWIEALRAVLPSSRIGGLGSAAAHSLPSDGDVTVYTAYAAIQIRLLDNRAPTNPTVLIIDDVHGYSAGLYAKALLPGFAWRLGLTAALARSDNLVTEQLVPYFSTVIPGCDYPHAVEESLLPRVRLVRVPVRLTEQEAHALRLAEDRAQQALDTLIAKYSAPDTPAGAESFARSEVGERGPGAVFAKRYLDAAGKRTEVLTECAAKQSLLRQLPVAALARTQSIFFTDRATCASRIVQLLSLAGLEVARTGEELSTARREEIARRLRERTLHAVVEHRNVDAALTVPHAGMAMILATELTERQLVQRLGRIVRPEADRPPVVVVTYVEGTSEDSGVGETALTTLGQISEEVVTTDAAELPALLTRWLAEPGQPAAEAEQVGRAERTPDRATPGRPTVADQVARTERPIEPRTPINRPEQKEPTSDVMTELVTELTAQGGVATADELGDLIGLTDPEEMFAAVVAAAESDRLDYRPIEEGSDELILLSSAAGGTPEQRRTALAALTAWAAHSVDPIDEFHRLVRDLGPVRVPRHRLIGVAAFVRGVAPAGLL
ncbi:DEAD/DEAH box helicase family protein [Nocardia sp. NPDC004654]|uniref:DEAD/DEAH box helicase n=1 Tax=Nocardia sp. NPDC004654 TaxID=3154776 RepID=UPI0033AB5AA5